MLKIIFYKKSDNTIVSSRTDGSSDHVIETSEYLFNDFIVGHELNKDDYSYAETDFPENCASMLWDSAQQKCIPNPNLVVSNGPRQSSSGIPSTDTSTV